ncbi:MAG: peroxiredoxin family protein [Candidatus Methylomirabilales bacterium]
MPGADQHYSEVSEPVITALSHRKGLGTRPPWGSVALLLLLLLMVLPARAQHPAPESDHLAPDFSLPDLQGKMVSLSQYKGKVVLLNFWATWCPPCRLEMPTMEKAYRKYKAQGFKVVAVSVDAGPKSVVNHFLRELGLSFQVLLDPQMATLRTFRSFSLPTSFVIDRQGVIRFRELGYRDWTDPESTKLLEALLSEASS